MPSIMIINMKARKMLSKVNESISSLKNTFIVFRFLDAFLYNLLGLALKRAVEFSIELTLSTMPIFKASYHMALVEL